ncbi:MAG: cell division ATP-binding protein FtsE [Alphaproteobacteria bacterium]|nr:cell division ATP-binding protein FtsE [Alphaproteobacteria bacterium]
MVRFENIGLRYGLGREVLKDVSFALAPGSFHFLVGESGAGKSSLLKLIYLALRPTRGNISLFGHEIASTPRDDLSALRRQIGVVFQEFKLLNHLSAFDNVALPMRVARAKRKDVDRHVTELLAWVGLKDHMQARPPTLSGGQQQRVAIARAVISRPSLLLADEPTGNVDDQMGLRLIHLFEELNRLGTSVIIATHSKQLVERLGYSQLQLTDGRLAIIPGRAEAEAAVAASAETAAEAEDIQNQHPDSRRVAAGEEDLYGNASGVESYL